MTSSNSEKTVIPIAITGISCRLPGGANSPEQLWELLDAKCETWSRVPENRFNEHAFHHPNGDDPNGSNNHRGGHFIDSDLDVFDHSFFRLSHQQAAAMDPQQRILLELSYEAMEDAGMTLEACAGTNTAVFAASFTHDFERNLYRDPLNLPKYYLTGVERALVSNRISHAFNLQGPSMTIDTGCSGGLVALHQACASLRNQEADAAIVASANITLGPDHHIGMSGLHLISGSGRSYPFDIRGDGYGRGEGCVALCIKRLDDALRDGDPIKAVIRNTAVNQDGHTAAGITYPNGAAQERLIRSIYEQANLNLKDTMYVESHGTGTVAGDHEEIKAIQNTFVRSEGCDRQAPLIVGSIKGNIGHTENTSGLASLIKACLVLDRLRIPPTAGLNNLKPGLLLDGIQLPTKTIAWPCSESSTIPARASINSFGFGGANAHAILEGRPSTGPDSKVPTGSAPESPKLFVLSANSQISLVNMLKAYYDWSESHSESAELARLLWHHRSRFPWRFSCVANDLATFRERLQDAICKPRKKPIQDRRNLVFIFTGQGAQWLGMGRELLLSSGAFQRSIRTSRDILRRLGASWDLESELLRTSSEQSQLNTAELAQPATTAIQIAILELLREMGLLESSFSVMGHSSGEIAAAYAAGYLDAGQAMSVAYHRGFMANAAKKSGLRRGAMLSVGLGEQEVLPFLADLENGLVTVACVNSPQSVTLSGDAEAVDEVAARLAAQEKNGQSVFRRRLFVDTAYHSHHMERVSEDYRGRLLEHFNETTFDVHQHAPFFSTVSGALKTSDFGADYWTSNLVSPVRYHDAVQTLLKDDHFLEQATSFIEIGPHPTLAGPLRQGLRNSEGQAGERYYSVLHRNVDAVESTLAFVGQMYDLGFDINLNEAPFLMQASKSTTSLSNLPSYTWDHSAKHDLESRVSKEYRFRRHPYHDLLGVRAMDATALEPRWRHMVSLHTLPWLRDHMIDSQVVFPGSGYVCMAIEGLRQLHTERHASPLNSIAVRDVSFLRSFVVPESPERTEMQLSLNPDPAQTFGYTFRITCFIDGQWHEQCTGSIEGILEPSETALLSEQNFTATHSAPSQRLIHSADEIVEGEALYAQMKKTGNGYGPTFAGIQRLTFTKGITLATVDIPDIDSVMPARFQQPHLIHPSTLDILLHASLPLASRHLGDGSIMPVHIDELFLSATESMPREPGSQLDVMSAITDSYLRTAHSNICVTTSGAKVMEASGIELRSLGSPSSTGKDKADVTSICYELDWIPDTDHLRDCDLTKSTALSLAQTISLFIRKRGRLSVLDLGDDCLVVAPMVFNALSASEIQRLKYNALVTTATTSNMSQIARAKLAGYPVEFKKVLQAQELYEQNFEKHSQDIVITQSLNSLSLASTFVNQSGAILLELDKLPENVGLPDWADASLQVQLSVRDPQRGSMVFLLRPTRIERILNETPPLHVLSRSSEDSTSMWAKRLQQDLLASEFKTFFHTLHSTGISDPGLDVIDEIGNDASFVILEDGSDSILSDPSGFSTVSKLLQKPAQVIWITSTDSVSKYQITGVARTAHAENEKLRLTTIQVAPEILSSGLDNDRSRLMDLCARILQTDGPHKEREYTINHSSTVLIPRLRHSLALNRAIHNSDNSDDTESHQHNFTDTSKNVKLNFASASPIFETTRKQSTRLDDEDIDIDVIAFSVSRFDVSHSTNDQNYSAYAGIVSNVCTPTTGFAIGDRVLAIGRARGANQIRVSSAWACPLPAKMLPAIGAGFLLDTMAACFVLQGQSRFSSESSVLVYDAASTPGRAAVMVAQSMGLAVSITADTASKVSSLAIELGVSPCDALSNSQLAARAQSNRRFDGIFLAGSVPASLRARDLLKTFGSVIIVADRDSRLSDRSRFAEQMRNNTVFSCDFDEALSENPGMIPRLVKQASSAFFYASELGLDTCVRPVNHISHALRLLEIQSCRRVVLEAESNAAIHLVSSKDTSSTLPAYATYVVTGGLGDLGQRLLLLMAGRGARHFVTLSRREVNSSVYSSFLNQLRTYSPCCNLYCIQCDLTSEISIQKAFEKVSQLNLPPIRGIIQSAAILQDRTLDTMSHEDFLRASQVKIYGTLALERTFASPELDFFLMLSSIVNIVGAAAQANYNAGNNVQDMLAHARKEQGRRCRYVSLNIGWIEDAINTKNDASRQSGLRRNGLRAITHDELNRFFAYVLEKSAHGKPPSQAIIGFTPESLRQATTVNGNIISGMFCHIHEQRANATRTVGSGGEQDGLTFEEAISRREDGVAAQIVFESLRTQLGRLISVGVEEVNHANSLLSLGVDSLVSIELRNWITRSFNAPIQTSEILTNQTMFRLSEKIVARSQARTGTPDTTSPKVDALPAAQDMAASKQPPPVLQEDIEASDNAENLPDVPWPSVEHTLDLFQKSREAIDSPEIQDETQELVRTFLEGIGPELCNQRKSLHDGKKIVSEAYERNIYLTRRDPIQNFGQFAVAHSLKAPRHSQLVRAAIASAAAIKFASLVANDELGPELLHGAMRNDQARKWMFYATRRPGPELDIVERHAPNRTIVVIRRGHFFKILLPEAGDIEVSALYAAYREIAERSQMPEPPPGTLTSDHRDSWASMRHDLEQDPENRHALAALDACAFVVCLDDQSPMTVGERHNQFLMGGLENPFSNRWNDKLCQLIVTANGLSAGIFGNTKIDGLDVRAFTGYLNDSLLSTGEPEAGSMAYDVETLHWRLDSSAKQRIATLCLQNAKYDPLDHLDVDVDKLGLKRLRENRATPHATIHLTSLLAVYLVDCEIRPAWQIASLGRFSYGRTDWVQTVTKMVRIFIEAAATTLTRGHPDAKSKQKLRQLLDAASTEYSTQITAAANGLGYVNHMYALLAMYQHSSQAQNHHHEQQDLPELFRSHAWSATRRGGIQQNLKIGVMPGEGDDEGLWDEGGFMMGGERGVYIHCSFRKKTARFAISGRNTYVLRVAEAMSRAADMMYDIIS